MRMIPTEKTGGNKPKVISTVISRITVAVDRASGGELAGRLSSALDSRVHSYAGAWQMISIAEEIFNRYNYPQASHTYRSFGESRESKKQNTSMNAGDETVNTSEQGAQPLIGEKATFMVQVQFRQNATWQGTIKWAEGKKTQRFRSTLEMIKLMDEAVSGVSEDTVSWQDADGSN